MLNESCIKFIERLSTKEPVPGGGGVAAFIGSMSAALSMMVLNLTTGKKRYAKYQDEIDLLLQRSLKIREELLSFVQKDADCFLPLSKAYSLPDTTEEEKAKKQEIMEEVLKNAALVPLDFMKKCVEIIDIHDRLTEIGSKLALSDAGVGVLLAKAAVLSAALNVYINTKPMNEKDLAEKLNSEAMELEKYAIGKADKVYKKVYETLTER